MFQQVLNMTCKICSGAWSAADQGLVMCSRCTQVVHGACDKMHIASLQQMGGAAVVYICPECRQALQAAEEQSKQLVLQYENQLRSAMPSARPRTAYTIFSAELAKIYAEESMGSQVQPGELEGVIRTAWDQLEVGERQQYEAKAGSEGVMFQAQLSQYTAFYNDYTRLCQSVGMVPKPDLSPQALSSGGGLLQNTWGAGQAGQAQRAAQGGAHRSSHARDHRSAAGAEVDENDEEEEEEELEEEEEELDAGAMDDDSDGDFGERKKKKRTVRGGRGGLLDSGRKRPRPMSSLSSMSNRGAPSAMPLHVSHAAPPVIKRAMAAAPGGITPAMCMEDLPVQMAVSCSGVRGTFITAEMVVVCACRVCASAGKSARSFHPTHWEAHCGAGSAKKWKASIKVEPGGAPEVPHGASAMPIGRYFDLRGVEFRPARTLGGPPVVSFIGMPLVRERGLVERIPRAPYPPRSSLKQELADLAAATPVILDDHRPRRERAAHNRSFSSLAGMAGGDGGREDDDDDEGEGAPMRPYGGREAVKRERSRGSCGWGRPALPTNSCLGSGQAPVPWLPWEDVSNHNYTPIKVRWAGDRCCVCDSDVDYDVDQMVSCDGCGIAVHQSCYGIPDLPGPDDVWLCRACEALERGEPEPQCCLCPVSGGALKPTTLPGGQWCHAACMQWVPEVSAVDPLRMEPIDRIHLIQRERWELLCCLCKQKMGAKIQCSTCYQAYHPLCARMAGLHMEIKEGKGGLHIVSYCPRHCRPRPELAGVQPVRDADGEGGGGEGGEGLWNCQPFPPPPAVPLPHCQEGCARAQPLVPGPWHRIFHGTGNGCTSLHGFWIPPEPDWSNLNAQLVEGLALQRMRAGRGGGRGGGRWGRGGGGRGGGRVGAEPPGPPQKVDLLPLPPGVPESLPIVCNHRDGVLLVRTQRVQYDGVDMAASRFEQLCGRGDAKKWKSSLWVVGPSGHPEITTGDWLNMHALDRAALAALAANAAAHEAYMLWRAAQNKAVASVAAAGDRAPGAGSGADLAAAGPSGGDQLLQRQQQVGWNGPSEGLMVQGAPRALLPQPSQSQQPPLPPLQPLQPPTQPQQLLQQAHAHPPAPQAGQQGEGEQAGSAQPVGVEAAAGAAGAEPPPAATAPADLPPPPPPPAMKLLRPIGMGLDLLRGTHEASAAAACMEAGSASSRPAECVGQCVRVYWPDDDAWYDADVVGWDPESRKHKLWYHIDENSEELDLVEEEAGSRLQWLPATDSSFWPPAPPAPARPPPPLPLPQDATEAGALADRAAEDRGGGAGVGQPGPSAVKSGEGQQQQQPPAAPSPQQPQQEELEADEVMLESDAALLLAAASEGAAAAQPPPPRPAPPPSVDVVCNGLRGTFLTERLEVRLADGRTVSGTEFERMAGRGAAKKWKVSIRVARPDGSYGCTIQDWMSSVGMEQPWRQPRGGAAVAAAKSQAQQQVLEAARRRASASVYRKREEGGAGEREVSRGASTGGPKVVRVHRPDCACCICKQARGVAERGAGGEDGDQGAAAGTPGAAEGTEPGAGPVTATAAAATAAGGVQGHGAPAVVHAQARGGPTVRYGKKAFVRAVPNLVGGLRRHKPWRVPSGRAWTQAEFDAQRLAEIVRAESEAVLAGNVDPDEAAVVPKLEVKQEPMSAAPEARQGVMAPAAAIGACDGAVAAGVAGASTANTAGTAAGEVVTGGGVGRGDDSEAGGSPLGWVIKTEPGAKVVAAPGAAAQPIAPPTSAAPAPSTLQSPATEAAAATPPQPETLPQQAVLPVGSSMVATTAAATPGGPEDSVGGAGMAGPGAAGVSTSGREGGGSGASEEGAPSGAPAPSGVTGMEGEGRPGGMRRVRPGVPWKQRLRMVKDSEPQKLTFGKSGIHGWGLFAVQDLPQDSLVMEYRGEAVRSSLADLREGGYRAVGADCYLFRATDATVIDSTVIGSWSRFTNHCCAPSLYTKTVVDAAGDPHIAFFAKTDIKPGQELTYDYRFKEEDTAAKVRCQCGAPQCKGFLN